jgi:hypothetical protein
LFTSEDFKVFQDELESIAFEMSKPFCYHCYIEAVRTEEHGNRCPKCFTDDLMRILPGDGPGWGIDWVIRSILATHCSQLSAEDLEERFMNMLNDCHDKVRVGGYEWDHGEAFKRLDEIAFQQELSAYIDYETDETIVTFDNGSAYFDKASIEEFINQNT